MNKLHTILNKINSVVATKLIILSLALLYQQKPLGT